MLQQLQTDEDHILQSASSNSNHISTSNTPQQAVAKQHGVIHPSMMRVFTSDAMQSHASKTSRQDGTRHDSKQYQYKRNSLARPQSIDTNVAQSQHAGNIIQQTYTNITQLYNQGTNRQAHCPRGDHGGRSVPSLRSDQRLTEAQTLHPDRLHRNTHESGVSQNPLLHQTPHESRKQHEHHVYPRTGSCIHPSRAHIIGKTPAAAAVSTEQAERAMDCEDGDEMPILSTHPTLKYRRTVWQEPATSTGTTVRVTGGSTNAYGLTMPTTTAMVYIPLEGSGSSHMGSHNVGVRSAGENNQRQAPGQYELQGKSAIKKFKKNKSRIRKFAQERKENPRKTRSQRKRERRQERSGRPQGRKENNKMANQKKTLNIPNNYVLTKPGDPMITRRLKAGPHVWVEQRKGKKGQKLQKELIGVWAPPEAVAEVLKGVKDTRDNPQYHAALDRSKLRRDAQEDDLSVHLQATVKAFLNFRPPHEYLAQQLAKRVVSHAIPVGSNTILRKKSTKNLDKSARARMATMAWLRHSKTCTYTQTRFRDAKQRKNGRRRAHEHNMKIIKKYRTFDVIDPSTCPLVMAVAATENQQVARRKRKYVRSTLQTRIQESRNRVGLFGDRAQTMESRAQRLIRKALELKLYMQTLRSENKFPTPESHNGREYAKISSILVNIEAAVKQDPAIEAQWREEEASLTQEASVTHEGTSRQGDTEQTMESRAQRLIQKALELKMHMQTLRSENRCPAPEAQKGKEYAQLSNTLDGIEKAIKEYPAIKARWAQEEESLVQKCTSRQKARHEQHDHEGMRPGIAKRQVHDYGRKSQNGYCELDGFIATSESEMEGSDSGDGSSSDDYWSVHDENDADDFGSEEFDVKSEHETAAKARYSALSIGGDYEAMSSGAESCLSATERVMQRMYLKETRGGTTKSGRDSVDESNSDSDNDSGSAEDSGSDGEWQSGDKHTRQALERLGSYAKRNDGSDRGEKERGRGFSRRECSESVSDASEDEVFLRDIEAIENVYQTRGRKRPSAVHSSEISRQGASNADGVYGSSRVKRAKVVECIDLCDSEDDRPNESAASGTAAGTTETVDTTSEYGQRNGQESESDNAQLNTSERVRTVPRSRGRRIVESGSASDQDNDSNIAEKKQPNDQAGLSVFGMPPEVDVPKRPVLLSALTSPNRPQISATNDEVFRTQLFSGEKRKLVLLEDGFAGVEAPQIELSRRLNEPQAAAKLFKTQHTATASNEVGEMCASTSDLSGDGVSCKSIPSNTNGGLLSTRVETDRKDVRVPHAQAPELPLGADTIVKSIAPTHPRQPANTTTPSATQVKAPSTCTTPSQPPLGLNARGIEVAHSTPSQQSKARVPEFIFVPSDRDDDCIILD
ncbi:hypothetical protein SARC_03435 [Sphaeroforma arctica JP610]|uniref:DUF2293 domain-containing protein n=1 Tax=Sphaeroforma arctica JP610 TaxID=667725 RepID=A0A0L0G5Q4_9EUKA|nr:hypothetical protein SARC_03435 [Sphaeroforma arctica JP610]KNC84355.1 hypothetical protein SARC_03435 [Sphaeroforma arctica JP610]|eukprot:XP_014158257.1 hypothetical protein SARC_03435 [Sphaeroforma arctica JP610]